MNNEEQKTKKDDVFSTIPENLNELKNCPNCGEPLRFYPFYPFSEKWEVAFCSKCQWNIEKLLKQIDKTIPNNIEEYRTVPELRPCPFCNRKNLWMEYYDFGRGFTDTIDAETEAIEIRCECGCSFDVNVSDIPDVEDKKAYAIGKWNGRV